MSQLSASRETRQTQLEEAFRSFNAVSEQLAHAYSELQQRVHQLSQELAASRTERMRQLAEKERLANRLSTLLDAIPGGVIVLDGEGLVSQFNPAAAKLFPTIRQDLSHPQLLSGAIALDHENGLVQLENGALVTLVEHSLDPEPGSILLTLDITETWELKQRLERRQRLTAVGEMAAQLAHQIRTPLASALIYSRHLGRGDLTHEQRERFSRQCHEGLLHIEHQVNDMLAFTRGGGFTPDEIDLPVLLEELRQQFDGQFRARGGVLELTGELSALPGLLGNYSALLGAFGNLLGNALQQVEGEPRVTIRVNLEGKRVRLQFEDNGPGIDPSICEQVFDPFFTTRPDGTGLGLAVVQSVVLAHGGSVSLHGEPGLGCRFDIELPRVSEAAGRFSVATREAEVEEQR